MTNKLRLLLAFLCCYSSSFAMEKDDSLQYYLQTQEYRKAICWLQANEPPVYDRAYLLNLGYCFYMNDEEKNAIPYYQAVYDREPNNLQASLYLGIINKTMKQYSKALAFYKNLISIKPDEYKYWLYAATMYSALNMEDSSFTHIEKAYRINPKAPDAVLRYSRGLFIVKNKNASVAVIDSFLQTDSNNVNVIERKINYSAKDLKHKEVVFWGERLLKDSVIAPIAYTDLAYAYLNTGQIEKSLSVYYWMKLENCCTESLTYCAALCYAQKNDFVRSNLLLDECLKQNLLQEAKTYFRSKANNYEKAKQYKKAIAQHDSSYYIFHSPFDLYYKGRIYDMFLNNKTQASVFYKRFIAEKQKPEGPTEEKLFNYIKEYIKP